MEWGRECGDPHYLQWEIWKASQREVQTSALPAQGEISNRGVSACLWMDCLKRRDLTQWSLPRAVARKLDILYCAEQNSLLSFRSQNPGPGAKELSSVTFQFILYRGQSATDNWTHSSFGDRMMLFNIQPDSWCAVHSEWAYSLITEECRIIVSHILNQTLHLFFLEI